jgi:hypothetical protein
VNHEKAVEIVRKLAAVNVGKTATDTRIVGLVGEARELVNPTDKIEEDKTFYKIKLPLGKYLESRQLAKAMDYVRVSYDGSKQVTIEDLLSILSRILY